MKKLLQYLSHSNKGSKQLNVIFFWCIAGILEGIAAITLQLSSPSDINHAWVLGLSKERFVILVGMFGILIAFGYLAYHVNRNSNLGKWVTQLTQNLLRRSLVYGTLATLTLIGFIFFSQLLHLATVVNDPYVKGYLSRLSPFLFWSLSLCIQTFLVLPILRYDLPDLGLIIKERIFRSSSLIFFMLLLAGVGVWISGLGIKPDKIGWDAPGVPILPIQVAWMWGLGWGFLLLDSWLRREEFKIGGNFRADILLSILIWLAAFGLWFQEPLTPAFFNPKPRAPNFEYYPHSDAALHDITAQQLLIGEGYPGVARKPLYALFLALLHGIAGQNYLEVVNLQVAVLALFPVFLYWLVKGLHVRTSGLVAAGLIILREQNAIGLSGEIRVSHAKMMMSDLPAAVAILVVTWLLVLWLQKPERHRLFPVGIGGGVGLLLLLRPQFVLLIPALFFLVMVAYFQRPLRGLLKVGLISLGLILTLGPWLWRSHQLTGKFTLNDPNQMAFLTQQYRLEPGKEILQQLPGEPESEFIGRVNAYIKEFMVENPGIVAGFITSHFAHNEIEMLQILPMSFWAVQNQDSELFPYWKQKWNRLWEECCSVDSYVDAIGFWDPIRHPIRTGNLLPILVNLMLISIGLGVMWIRHDFIGLIPLIIGLVYSLSTAVGRYSGWRLILPADWIVFLYFSIGIGQVTLWLHAYYSGDLENQMADSKERTVWQRIKSQTQQSPFPTGSALLFSGVLLGIGLIPLMVEAAIPHRYATVPAEDLIAKITMYNGTEIQQYLGIKNLVVIQGRALYPRFFRAGEGEPGDGWSAFSTRDFNRVGFILLGPAGRKNVILPMEDPPVYFPNASDVIVVGCVKEDYFESLIVMIESNDPVTLINPSFSNLGCLSSSS